MSSSIWRSAASGFALFACFMTARSASAEKRVVVYRDGAPPRIELQGTRFVRGPVELEVRYENTQPLCYAYTTKLGMRSKRQAAFARLERATEPRVELAEPEFQDIGAALAAVEEAKLAVDRVLAELRATPSLSQLWRTCGSDTSGQGAAGQQLALVTTLTQKTAANGDWQRAVAQAEGVDRGARSALVRAQANAELARRELEERRQSLLQAQSEAQSAKVPDPAKLEQARAAVVQAEARVAELANASNLGNALVDLNDKRRAAERSVMKERANVERAKTLLANAPSDVSYRIAAGESGTVSVTRSELDNGRASTSAAAEIVATPEIETLQPILLDISVGPALTWEHTRAYGLGVAYIDSDVDKAVTHRVIRTEEELNLDGVVSISGYIWGARYLDDTVFDWMQLLPRPMLGLSMRQAFSSFYVGGQIDPIQFIDISVGARWYTRERLIGPQLGERALTDSSGRPAEPVTQDEFKVQGFAAITFSTDLLARWIKRTF